MLKETFAKRPTKEWLDVLEGCSLPYGPVNSLSEAFTDPHVVHNRIVQTIEHPSVGPVKQVAPAVSFSESQNRIRRPPPLLGQHTRDVLTEVLDYPTEEVEKLVRNGAVYCHENERKGLE